MPDTPCPICGNEAELERIDVPFRDEWSVECETCGGFRLTTVRAEALRSDVERNPGLDGALGELIRERNARGRRPQVGALLVDAAIRRAEETRGS